VNACSDILPSRGVQITLVEKVKTPVKADKKRKRRDVGGLPCMGKQGRNNPFLLKKVTFSLTQKFPIIRFSFCQI
jgi:hypothetical protein